MHAEDLAVVLFPILDGEIVQVVVEKLNAAISRCCENLVLVDFRPGEVIEGILGGEPGNDR